MRMLPACLHIIVAIGCTTTHDNKTRVHVAYACNQTMALLAILHRYIRIILANYSVFPITCTVEAIDTNTLLI